MEDPPGGWEHSGGRERGESWGLAKISQEGDICSRTERTECIYRAGRVGDYSRERNVLSKIPDGKWQGAERNGVLA